VSRARGDGREETLLAVPGRGIGRVSWSKANARAGVSRFFFFGDDPDERTVTYEPLRLGEADKPYRIGFHTLRPRDNGSAMRCEAKPTAASSIEIEPCATRHPR
jgi:hypothetical protein